jgi:poly(3-hydroxybutyrate) depolymerase
MSLPRSDSRLLVWSAAFLVTLAACGSGTGEGGSGGSGTGGETASGGTTGSGGAGPATGGNNGTGGNGTGGSGPATGGSVGTGGHATGGAAGAPSGTGGGAGGSATGGTGPGTGGAGGKGTGGTGPGTGGAGGKGTGGTGPGTGGAGGKGTGGSATGGAGGSASMSSGCGKAPTIASSNYNNGHHIAITVGGMAREYILNVPTNYDNTKPYKFVIAYHELNGNDDEMYKNKYYHLLPLSNDTTIFVAPNGQQNNANCTQASGCGWPNPSDTDMKLADAVVAQIEQNFCVDTNRIFATGWSYGASMSEQTACERPLTGAGATNPWGVRAIAVYSVAYLSNTDNCKATSSKPVAYYASHGTNDTVLPYSGGVSIAQTWAAADGCTAATPTQATGNHVCTNYTGCSAGYPVEFCSFVGPHTPDPTDSGGGTSWEYQNVWTFLSQF